MQITSGSGLPTLHFRAPQRVTFKNLWLSGGRTIKKNLRLPSTPAAQIRTNSPLLLLQDLTQFLGAALAVGGFDGLLRLHFFPQANRFLHSCQKRQRAGHDIGRQRSTQTHSNMRTAWPRGMRQKTRKSAKQPFIWGKMLVVHLESKQNRKKQKGKFEMRSPSQERRTQNSQMTEWWRHTTAGPIHLPQRCEFQSAVVSRGMEGWREGSKGRRAGQRGRRSSRFPWRREGFRVTVFVTRTQQENNRVQRSGGRRGRAVFILATRGRSDQGRWQGQWGRGPRVTERQRHTHTGRLRQYYINQPGATVAFDSSGLQVLRRPLTLTRFYWSTRRSNAWSDFHDSFFNKCDYCLASLTIEFGQWNECDTSPS